MGTETIYAGDLRRVELKVKRRDALEAFRQRVPLHLQGEFQPKPDQLRYWREAVHAFDAWAQRVAGSHEGLLLMGPQGRGKSVLLGLLCRRGAHRYALTPQYIDMGIASAEIDDARRMVHGARSRTEFLQESRAGDLLVMDDVGYSDSDDKELFRQIVQFASDAGKFLVIAANLDEEALWKYMGADNREKSRLYNLKRIQIEKAVPDYRMARGA